MLKLRILNPFISPSSEKELRTLLALRKRTAVGSELGVCHTQCFNIAEMTEYDIVNQTIILRF